MSIKLLEDHLTPAEGEQVVKTYHCTTLDPMLLRVGSRINGYISVTNKRLIYFANGYSGFGAKGNSRVSIELPIADVCNVEQAIGTRFDMVRLIVGLITAILCSSLANILVDYLIYQFMPNTGSNLDQFRLQFFLKIVLATFLVAQSLLVPWNRLTRMILAATGAGIIGGSVINQIGILDLRHLLPMGLNSALDMYMWMSQVFGSLAFLFVFWCLYWFIRMIYLVVAISSKGGQIYPIYITGFSLRSRSNIAALTASTLSPATDADKMFKELGALVTDIQTLGDHGIKKWSQNANDVNPEQETVASNCAAKKTMVLRYAIGFVITIAILMIGEFSITTYNRHQVELRQAATTDKQQADNAKNNANIDRIARETMPQMVAKAEQEQLAGEAAFNIREYSRASEHWKLAVEQFSKIPEAVKPYRDAEALRIQYENRLQELISLTSNQMPKTGVPSIDDMEKLSSYLESHAPEEWILVKDAVRKAEAFKAASQGLDYLDQWTQIVNVLTPAVTKKVRTDISKKTP